MINIRQQIKHIRKRHGWTQTQLADLIGSNYANIANYELGRVDPPSSIFMKILEVDRLYSSRSHPPAELVPTPISEDRKDSQ
ncbi:MAG: helix-turn-helix transcriptional regulator [Deltaproteobacteria bacterium]|nr:helix-turn-helix transcriptional regulator [Deltaproteobacteria bacterium]